MEGGAKGTRVYIDGSYVALTSSIANGVVVGLETNRNSEGKANNENSPRWGQAVSLPGSGSPAVSGDWHPVKQVVLVGCKGGTSQRTTLSN